MNSNQTKHPDKSQKEQIETEYKARRNYRRKGLQLYEGTPWPRMYNQNEINKQIEESLTDVCPFVYANEGDSYFVSPEMYQALVAVCRCGRPRRGLHLLKCLQNQKNKCATSKQQKDIDNPKEHRIFNKLPETTNGFVGYTQQQQAQQPSYKKWEDSMKYRSPQYDMPGQRITATSYNTIIIG